MGNGNVMRYLINYLVMIMVMGLLRKKLMVMAFLKNRNINTKLFTFFFDGKAKFF